ncbi:unnamed protein product [Protopolystoma xenopodis]|uniref:Uncharacterized protein n=1 Tax=Protopolystoma xenopodis TaxID=117903 RepID=A0A448X1R7_9PLAT|nr:unnamed protein product [Protopolystoma xenopodis]
MSLSLSPPPRLTATTDSSSQSRLCEPTARRAADAGVSHLGRTRPAACVSIARRKRGRHERVRATGLPGSAIQQRLTHAWMCASDRSRRLEVEISLA